MGQQPPPPSPSHGLPIWLFDRRRKRACVCQQLKIMRAIEAKSEEERELLCKDGIGIRSNCSPLPCGPFQKSDGVSAMVKNYRASWRRVLKRKQCSTQCERTHCNSNCWDILQREPKEVRDRRRGSRGSGFSHSKNLSL